MKKDTNTRMMVWAGLLVAIASLSQAALLDAAQGSSICAKRTVVDYGRPFDKMPADNPPPRSGRLPFAPKFSRFYETALGSIQSGGGGFGYAFSGVAPPARAVRLDWHVVTRLEEVDIAGRRKTVSSRRREIIRTVHNLAKLDFWVRLSKRPALYRYVIEFHELDGRSLATYSKYLRVLPSRVRAVLRSDAVEVLRGSHLRFQLANFGTVPISYGEGISVEHFDGERWSPSPFFKAPRIRKAASILPPGSGSPCEPLAIPLDAPPGRYRAVKVVRPLSSSRVTTVMEFMVK